LNVAMKALNAGQPVIRTTGTYCYFDYYQTRNRKNEPPAAGWGFIPLRRVYQCDPTRNIPEDKRHLIRGSQGNVWTESAVNGDQADYMAFPRGTALAEALWSPLEKRDYGHFFARLDQWLERLKTKGVNYRDPRLWDGLPLVKISGHRDLINTSKLTLEGQKMPGIDEDIIKWQWDVDGDGKADYHEQNIVHTYTSAGTYKVTLTVQAQTGQSDTASVELVVSPPPPKALASSFGQ